MTDSPGSSLDFRHLDASLLRQAAGKSILITGAAGMVGSRLALTFLEADRRFGLGMSVHGLSRNMARALGRFRGFALTPWSLDVSSDLSALPRFDLVVHAASPVGPAVFRSDPAGIVSANLRGTVNLLDKAVRDRSERFMFISTHEVYGEGRAVWREEDSGVIDFLSVRACYPESKRAGENACVCFHRQHGLGAVIARLSRVIGPGINLDSGLFVCDFLKDGLAGRDVAIRGNGNLVRPLCHLDDVVAALFRVLFDGEAGGAYNVAPADRPTIAEVARTIAGLAGVGVVLPEKNGPAGGSVQDIGKLSALGWRPEIGWVEAIARTWAGLSPSG